MSEDKLRILSRHDPPPSRVNELIVGGCAIGGAVCALGFAVVLLAGGPLPAYGSLLALSCFLLAIAVRRYFTGAFPEIDATQPRELPEDPDPSWASVEPVGRRPLLVRLLLGAAGVLSVALLALVPSLGPRVGDRLRRTPWRQGLPLVTGDGEMIRPDDVAAGGVVTAWPQGAIGFERAAVLVLRVTGDLGGPTNLDWVIDGNLVAYSKICTHAGCPVALFRERDDALFCPCHQSTFDVARGAVPIFGPAARALPQLPLTTNSDGFLVALGDFETQAGPAFG